MSENPKAILEIKNLDISFKTNAGVVHAIRGVNLDLQKGETVAIVGESGSGKSVTMKAAMGLLDSNATVNSGEILYTYTDEAGERRTVDLLTLPKKQLRQSFNGQRIAMVFQDPMTSLDPTMTIGKQIMEGMLLHRSMSKEAAKARALELLELVGITDAEKRFKNYPHQLSGGMRQRVVIAIALSADPDILICDEPTTALDVTIQARILELIMDIQKKMGLSVIYITHDLGVVANVAERVAVLYAGQAVLCAARRRYGFLRITAVLTLVIPAALGVFALLDWERLFIGFHRLAFRNDYWLFDPATDPVINALPDTFFFHCAAAILILVLLGSILCEIAYRILRNN